MKKIDSILLTFCLLLIITFQACKKSNETSPDTRDFSNCIFVSNEGPFNSGTGTISSKSFVSGKVEHEIFQQENSRPLGNIVQSIEVYKDLAYIVVNNMNKIEVVDAKTFKSHATINDVVLPRYFLGISDNKAYVTSWDNVVAVIDLNSNTVIKQIPTATGPEKMIKVNNKVFVLNQGGFSTDSIISIIDCESDTILENLIVGQKPSGIRLDKNNNLWVLCSGFGWNGMPDENNTPGKLTCLDIDNYSILKEFVFPSYENHPEKLIINSEGDFLFYNYPGGIFRFNINDFELPATPFIQSENIFYSIAFDKINNRIYASDALDFVQNGNVFSYNALDGSLFDSFNVGIIPGSIYFYY